MADFNNKISQCNICRQEYTSFHFEAMPGFKIYVCQNCLKAAKHNFIWICMNCGKSYFRPKNLVMKRINGYGIKEASILNESQIIQGIYMCIKCNPKGICDYINSNKKRKECAA